MTFVRVKIGEFEVLANADCYVAVLIDWMRLRIGEVLGGGSLQGDLDLCDEMGNPRLLWALPATVNTLKVLTPRAVYYLVLRAKPTDSFKLVRPIGKPELLRAVHDRLRRAVAAWSRVRAKLGPDATPDQLVESVRQNVSQQVTRAQRRGARPESAADKWQSLREKVEHEVVADKVLTAFGYPKGKARQLTAKV